MEARNPVPELELDEVDRTDDGRGAAPRLAVLLALLAAGILAGADVAADLARGEGIGAHLALEAAVGLAAALALGLLVRESAAARRRAGRLARALGDERERAERLRVEAERWRAEAGQALGGLGAAIDAQLARWGVTEAERAVALLLLAGKSHKEIAHARGTSERTVRQQALAVYRKAGLDGRAALAAFFLAGIAAPRAAGAPR